jgi:hypothetical protein
VPNTLELRFATFASLVSRPVLRVLSLLTPELYPQSQDESRSALTCTSHAARRFPLDEEVAALEASEAQGQEAYQLVTQWAVIPVWIRTTLVTGALLMSAATGLFLLGGSYWCALQRCGNCESDA